jgi:hypothetical protein
VQWRELIAKPVELRRCTKRTDPPDQVIGADTSSTQ